MDSLEVDSLQTPKDGRQIIDYSDMYLRGNRAIVQGQTVFGAQRVLVSIDADAQGRLSHRRTLQLMIDGQGVGALAIAGKPVGGRTRSMPSGFACTG